MAKKGEPLTQEQYIAATTGLLYSRIKSILAIAEDRGFATTAEKEKLAELRESIRDIKAGKDWRRHIGGDI